MALPPLSPEARHLRAGYAHARRFHPDAPETEALGLEFRATRLADHIKAQIDKAPPLTLEQREQLARILRPTPAAGGNTR